MNKKQLQNIISQGENEQVEFKRMWKDDFFWTTFYKNQELTNKQKENVVEKSLSEILKLIKSNNKISKLLNITSRTAQRDIEKLKQQGKLKRIGSDKGGKWEVIL